MLLLLFSQEQMFSHLKIISGLVILEAKSGISIKMLKQHESAAVSSVLTYRSVQNGLFHQNSWLPFGCIIFLKIFFAVDEFIRNFRDKDLQVTFCCKLKAVRRRMSSHGGSKLQRLSDLRRLGRRCRQSAAICW